MTQEWMSMDAFLVINSGSSSLKFGLYSAQDLLLLLSGQAERVGTPEARFAAKDNAGKLVVDEPLESASQTETLEHVAGRLDELHAARPTAIGHRVVHGGPMLTAHQRITPMVLQTLRESVHFAPLHIPASVELIEATQRIYPDTPEFACFDTAFHTTMPEEAMHFALPQKLWEQGIRRYGFHGISYESIVHVLRDAIPERVVAAHLGNGCSVAAILNGQSVDTSMGLTPVGGIPMSTRSGDLDPGVVVQMIRGQGLDADALEKLLNKQSGLAAIAGGISDMRELEKAAKAGDAAATLAVEIFTRSIRKTIAGYAAVMGGIDLLVFTGGIGEHSAFVRGKVCAGLEFIGVEIDAERNAAGEKVISRDGAKCMVRIVESDEDGQIARHIRDRLK